MNNITKNPLKLIKNIFIFLCFFSTFFIAKADVFKGEMLNQNQDKVQLRFAITKEEQTRGLSGLKSDQFKMNEAMLFVNKSTAPRKFWMPDTYFPLDIIFLDSNLRIVGITYSAPAHPGMSEPPEIFKTEVYLAQFILETKAKSPFSKKLKIGDKLKFAGKISLSEIISKIHPEQ